MHTHYWRRKQHQDQNDQSISNTNTQVPTTKNVKIKPIKKQQKPIKKPKQCFKGKQNRKKNHCAQQEEAPQASTQTTKKREKIAKNEKRNAEQRHKPSMKKQQGKQLNKNITLKKSKKAFLFIILLFLFFLPHALTFGTYSDVVHD